MGLQRDCLAALSHAPGTDLKRAPSDGLKEQVDFTQRFRQREVVDLAASPLVT